VCWTKEKVRPEPNFVPGSAQQLGLSSAHTPDRLLAGIFGEGKRRDFFGGRAGAGKFAGRRRIEKTGCQRYRKFQNARESMG
jgi:hypothetical protein